MVWSNPTSLSLIRKSDPKLASQIDSLSIILKTYNLLFEAKELGLSIDASTLDVETIHLVYLLKEKLQARQAKADSSKSKGVKRRGR